jgi:hypothetical protein
MQIDVDYVLNATDDHGLQQRSPGRGAISLEVDD